MELEILKKPITLTTERLTISLMEAEDFSLFYRLQADEQLMRYIGPVLSREEIQEKFNHRIKPWDGDEQHWLTFKIIINQGQQFAGSIGFRLVDIESERAEIGYLLLTEHQGKGYMTEAAQCLVNFLFTRLKVMKIEAHCSTKNSASWQIMEKLGMQREAHLKSHTVLNDERLDDFSYGLLSPLIS